MDFIIKYHVKIVEFSSFEKNELNLSDKDISSYVKCTHKIILQKLIFDIKLQLCIIFLEEIKEYQAERMFFNISKFIK